MSAYTAGSSRQNQLDNIQSSYNNNVKDSVANISNENTNSDVNQKRTNEELTEKDEEISKKPRIETSDEPHISMPQQSNDTNTNQISKEDAILSAKERYLARKNKS